MSSDHYVFVFFFLTDEFIQHEGSDAALVDFRRLRFAVGRRRRVDGLLAADGGGNRPAAEPDHRGEDGAALRPLEGLLRGRLATISCRCHADYVELFYTLELE